jgi:hypothetical protein
MLRRGPKGKKVIEGCEKCIRRNFINLHHSPNINRVIKSMRIKWE